MAAAAAATTMMIMKSSIKQHSVYSLQHIADFNIYLFIYFEKLMLVLCLSFPMFIHTN